MTGWMRGPELDRSAERAAFDPVAAGTRYQLSRELSLAIWERACADATDAHGWRDLVGAQLRFHDLAARIAGRGGELGPGVGKWTAVGVHRAVSRGGFELPAPGRHTLVSAEVHPVPSVAIPVPGRQTQVTAEAERWLAADVAHTPLAGDPAAGSEQVAARRPGPHISGASPRRATRFEDFLALGLQHVLDAARARGDTRVPAIAGGRAMWRAAERRAATLYRRAVDAGEVEHDGMAVEAALQRCGAGQPLTDGVRRALEARLGVPLGRVRIHTDRVAADAARAVNAEAFTVGEDIFFAEGAYAPESPAGQRLLVHELTHVVQSWQGRTGHDGRISQPGDALEREADAAADRTHHDAPAHHADPPAMPPAAPPVRAAGSQPLLRRAAAPSGAPAQNVPAMRGGVQPTAAQTPQPQPPGASTDFVHRASQTGAQAVQQLHRGIAEARANPTGDPAAAAKDHQSKGRADAHKARRLEQHHHARADAHASHSPVAKEAAGEAHAAVDVHAPIAFKPISDWSKYLPERGPGQDDHQRKQAENQVKAQIESDRQDARRGLEKLRAAHIQLARDVRSAKPRLLAQIASSQRDALAQVARSESSQCAAVQSSFAAAQGQVRSHAAAAKGQVASAHAAAVAQIHESHQAAIQHLAQKQTSALTEVKAGEALALASLAVDFAGLKASLTDLGFKKAADAITTGNLEAAKMPAQWDGDKLDAAQKAARDTADGFATSMPQQASHQYDQVAAQRPEAERSLHDFAHATRDNIGKAHDSAKHAIDASLHSSIQAADSAQSTAIAQIDQACSSTLATLGAQRASQVAAIRQQAQSARSGIASAAAGSRASLSQSCDRAASGIEGGVAGLIRGARQIEAPHPEDTRRQVTQGVQDVAQGAQGAAAGLSQTATRSAQGLTQQASSAAAGMASTAAAAQQSANQLAAGAGQQMAAMARGASDGLAQTAAAHKATTDRTLHTATSTFTQQVKTLGDHYRTVAKQRQDQFRANVRNTKASLDGTVPDHGGAGGGRGSGKQDDGGGKSGSGAPKAEVPSIQDNAKKAADAVKPWWQQALAVVVSVVVAIAVVVVVTALITTTGPVGAILVGALAGALSSMAGTIASNLVLGNNAWQGITWKSIAMGAVSGAIGAGLTEALSAGAEALAGSGSMLARGASMVKTVMSEGAAAEEGGAATELTAGQKLLKTGLDVGNDFVTNQATSLIFDHKLDLSVESLAMSLATHVGTNHTRLGDLQAGAQAGIKSHLPFDIKVPKLQIEIGNPSRGGGGHGGEPAASSSHAGSSEPTGAPAGAPSHGGAPASHAGGDSATPGRGSSDGGAARGSGGEPGSTPARGGAEPPGAPHASGAPAPHGSTEPTQAHGSKSTPPAHEGSPTGTPHGDAGAGGPARGKDPADPHTDPGAGPRDGAGGASGANGPHADNHDTGPATGAAKTPHGEADPKGSGVTEPRSGGESPGGTRHGGDEPGSEPGPAHGSGDPVASGDEITAAPVPGSKFSVDNNDPVRETNGKAAQQHFKSLAEKQGLEVSQDGDTYHLTTPDGDSFTVKVTAEELTGSEVARTAVETPGKEYTVRISDRAAPENIERAMAHELAEITALRQRSPEEQRSPGDNALAPGKNVPEELSPHDHGRLAELDVLSRQYREATQARDQARDTHDAAKQAQAEEQLAGARRELQALIDHLGLREGTPGSAERRRLIDDKRKPSDGELLDELRRPDDKLSPEDKRVYKELRDQQDEYIKKYKDTFKYTEFSEEQIRDRYLAGQVPRGKGGGFVDPYKATPPSETARPFADRTPPGDDGWTAENILGELKSTGAGGNDKSFGPFAKRLAECDPPVTDAEMVKAIEQFADDQGKQLDELTEDQIRHQLKKTYQDRIYDQITDPEYLEQQYSKAFEGVDRDDPAQWDAAVKKARHQAMLDTVDALHLKDGTNLSERWFTDHYAKGSRTQVTIDKVKLAENGIEITKTRQADNIVTTTETNRAGVSIDRNTIKDVKSHTGKLSAADEAQYRDYRKLIGNNVPLTDRSTIPIHGVTEVFLRPEGGLANAEFIATELSDPTGNNLSFEVFDSRGERWEIKKTDVRKYGGTKRLAEEIARYCSQ